MNPSSDGYNPPALPLSYRSSGDLAPELNRGYTDLQSVAFPSRPEVMSRRFHRFAGISILFGETCRETDC